MDSYLEIEEHDWIKELAERAKSKGNESDSVLTSVWNTVAENQSVKVDFSNYVGTYIDNWFGEVEISEKNGKLWFTSKRSPKLNGQMLYYKATTFAVKWDYKDMEADAFAIFSLDEEGKATGIKMKGISPNMDFSFDFHDLDLKRIPD